MAFHRKSGRRLSAWGREISKFTPADKHYSFSVIRQLQPTLCHYSESYETEGASEAVSFYVPVHSVPGRLATVLQSKVVQSELLDCLTL